MPRFSISLAACWLLLLPLAADAQEPRQKPNPAGPAQQELAFEGEIKVKVKLKYLLYLPEGYETRQAWPLLVFLHGAGESGDDLSKVKIHGPPKLVESKRDFPFVVLSPQSPRRGWDIHAVNALIDSVIASHKIDPDRVYVTGLSMGGYGTWALACAYPEKFAAIAPICGGGNPAEAAKLKDLPVWAFHGAKDAVVPPSQSEAMIEAIKAAGGQPKYTLYPQAGHDSWTETYNNPELYAWLLEHKRKKS